MKNLLFATSLGFALLFVEGVYAQEVGNEWPGVQIESIGGVHPMDAPRYQQQPHPMEKKWYSAPTRAPAVEY